MVIPLFTVPAGTHIEDDGQGGWAFYPPGEPAFTARIYLTPDGIEVHKTTVDPKCDGTITVGTIRSKH